jgi:hypothetical protein
MFQEVPHLRDDATELAHGMAPHHVPIVIASLGYRCVGLVGSRWPLVLVIFGILEQSEDPPL